jgi:hypothetical protein
MIWHYVLELVLASLVTSAVAAVVLWVNRIALVVSIQQQRIESLEHKAAQRKNPVDDTQFL